jgi:hypothetical protein
MNLNLHSALTNSYINKKDSAFDMLKHGYQQDPSLSNHNQQVYYNNKDKKLLVSVAGTHNLSDWGTDVMLGLGRLKNTKRYKEADDILKKAKQKYNVPNATVIGHSLGGSIASGIASKAGGDKYVGLDAGYTIGQKTSNNPNFKSLRTQGDAVSLLGANAKHMTTLKNNIPNTGIRPLDVLNAHNINQIRDNKIFI